VTGKIIEPDWPGRVEHRYLRHILSRVVVHRELAPLREEEHSEPGELLAEGRELKDRFRCDRNLLVDVRRPESLLRDDNPIADDGDGYSSKSGSEKRQYDRIDRRDRLGLAARNQRHREC
jgi:hypothetical protein